MTTPTQICQEAECETRIHARGKCYKHYVAMKRAGAKDIFRGISWTPEDYEDYWMWVQKELKIVQ